MTNAADFAGPSRQAAATPTRLGERPGAAGTGADQHQGSGGAFGALMARAGVAPDAGGSGTGAVKSARPGFRAVDRATEQHANLPAPASQAAGNSVALAAPPETGSGAEESRFDASAHEVAPGGDNVPPALQTGCDCQNDTSGLSALAIVVPEAQPVTDHQGTNLDLNPKSAWPQGEAQIVSADTAGRPALVTATARLGTAGLGAAGLGAAGLGTAGLGAAGLGVAGLGPASERAGTAPDQRSVARPAGPQTSATNVPAAPLAQASGLHQAEARLPDLPVAEVRRSGTRDKGTIVAAISTSRPAVEKPATVPTNSRPTEAGRAAPALQHGSINLVLPGPSRAEPATASEDRTGQLFEGLSVVAAETHLQPLSPARATVQQISDAIRAARPLRPPPPDLSAEQARKPVLKTLQIQLQPADLGLVTVRMSLRHDVLELNLEVSNRTTASVIEQHRQALHDALRTSGYSLDGLTVQIADAAKPLQLSGLAADQDLAAQPQSPSDMNSSGPVPDQRTAGDKMHKGRRPAPDAPSGSDLPEDSEISEPNGVLYI